MQILKFVLFLYFIFSSGLGPRVFAEGLAGVFAEGLGQGFAPGA